MQKKQIINKYTIAAAVAVVAILLYLFYFKNGVSAEVNTNTISIQTDKWINAVTVENDPGQVADLFCEDGNLVGTVSQTIRTGPAIKSYFDYFALLPDIEVVDKKYDIVQVKGDVFLNTAFITWKWDGLKEPIVARMSFLFRGDCIFQLHSSALPDLNEDLKKIS